MVNTATSSSDPGLLSGDATVPHISVLGLDRASLQVLYNTPAMQVPKVARTTKHQKVEEAITDKVHWMNTWSEYVRGHIVSKSAAR